LIGEIKKMENGILTIETDYSDKDFTLKWIDVISIKSDQFYLISLNNGGRFNSKLDSENPDGKVNLTNNGQIISVKIADIVYIKPVESNFISRLDASLSIGLNFSKNNNLRQLNSRSNLSYSSKYWQLSGAFDAVRSSQTEIENIQRTDANIQFTYYMENDYFSIFRSEFLSNDEQKLDLRVANRFGVGKYIIHSNIFNFGGGAGLVWNNEQYTDAIEGNRNSVEAFGAISLNIFDMKNFDLLTNLSIFPSITERKRWRIDYKLDLKYDLPLDLFIKAGVTYNFDNQPVEGASTNDYIIQTTFGWEL
jgi:hypothetical protein